jgi:leucyl/phenylalanyl-tRNA--protein transferase
LNRDGWNRDGWAGGFPPVETWPADEPIAMGGDLSVERLVSAYARGIFPWPVEAGPRGLLWWSPDPRAILDPARLHVPRRLERTLRSGAFELSFDRSFADVVRGCAVSGTRRGATWITPEMAAAYGRLHAAGIAHSVEVWGGGRLVGGLYGVCLGGMFAGESMFSLERDASKVALVGVVRRLAAAGCQLFDVQVQSPHLAQFGAEEISRWEFLERLRAALSRSHCWPADAAAPAE